MPTVRVNARVGAAIKRAVEEYCRTRGIVMNRFVRKRCSTDYGNWRIRAMSRS